MQSINIEKDMCNDKKIERERERALHVTAADEMKV